MDYAFTITIPITSLSITTTVETAIPGGGAVPVITEIDGGNSGNDTQFTGENGLLDGCGA